MNFRLIIPAAIPMLAMSMACLHAQAVGNFGPTGLEITIQPDRTIVVTGVQPGSPAEGEIHKDDVIEKIDASRPPADAWERRAWLADPITAAEAGDGVVHLAVRRGAGEPRIVELNIPRSGSYNEQSPHECAKTRAIIRANAAYLRNLAADDAGLARLAGHNMHTGLAILALLATGEEGDLEVVRRIFRHRMNGFDRTDTGPHSWHNGWQGIAVCEYYLRTGDTAVMPLINAICESARKFQVNGGWTHWATGVNPQYVGGGLLNAAGTNILTTLLLAKQCGAKVDEKTLQDALRFFYRFAGHGSNPYGDHRPEGGYGSNNGKTEQIAIAMHIASRAENGAVYAMARDKSALTTVHAYRHMLGGHTGPIGLMYYGTVAPFIAAKKPELYANWREETRWFRELSRRHTGAFGLSHGARYDNEEFGRSLMLDFAAPLRTLQITGAPASPHAKPFALPELPWGRPADVAFLGLDGGPGYRPLANAPHLEYEMIATAGKDQLVILAGHPEHTFREATAAAIRDGGHVDLVETLLESPDPLSRHTACLALNDFNPWSVSRGRGWLSARSIHPERFTQRMFDALIKMVRDPDEALWLVDQSMIALALAKPEQTMAHLDALLPWLGHDDWWLHESASMALSPALLDPQGLDRVLPEMGRMIAHSPHTKGRGFVEWMLTRTAAQVDETMKTRIASMLKAIYQNIPSQPAPAIEGDMDLTGISSVHLNSTLNWALTVNPDLAVDLAELSVPRLADDMRTRELNLQTNQLIDVSAKLDAERRRALGRILDAHYKPAIIAEHRDILSRGAAGNARQFAGPLDTILRIQELAGTGEGWRLLGNNAEGAQVVFRHSFNPAERPADSTVERYRPVELPPGLEGWHLPGFDAEAAGWRKSTADFGDKAPSSYRNPREWNDALGNAGEVLLVRKEFDLEDLDHELFRIVAFTRQGYRIYLNGEPVVEERGRSRNWQPRTTPLNGEMRSLLKPGRNVISAISFLQYFGRGPEGDLEVYLEGLREFPKVN